MVRQIALVIETGFCFTVSCKTQEQNMTRIFLSITKEQPLELTRRYMTKYTKLTDPLRMHYIFSKTLSQNSLNIKNLV